MTTFSIWEQESFYAKTDIIIAGAGLMGLWTAIELKLRNSNLQVLIIERNCSPLGASTRNAGFACFGSPTELWYDYKTTGINEMLTIVEKRHKGVEKIKQYFTPSILQYNNCGGYECLEETDGDLGEKITFLNKHLQQITKKENTFITNNSLLKQFGLTNFSTIIENNLEGSLHSGFYVKALIKKAISLGIDFLFGLEITNWNNAESHVEVLCHNTKFYAKQFIVCTNAFTNKLLGTEYIKPARGQIILTSPIKNLKLNGTFHFDEGFYYWRHFNNCILLGGARNMAFEEEETIDLEISNKVQKQLELFLQKHIAADYEYTIAHRWSGIMAFTQNKQPLFQKINSNTFLAIACNGMGVALTPIFAENVAENILAEQ